MRLKSGQSAVPFTTETVAGNSISLAQFAGTPVLLMFLRYASCPMCNLRLHDFAQRYARLQRRGLTAVIFFHSSAPSIRAHAGGRRYPFPLVADPELRIYGRYGVETSWPRLLLSMAKPHFYADWFRSMRHRFWGGVDRNMAKMPAEFLVGPDGRIVVAHYGREIGDHLAIERIENLLDTLDRPTSAAEAVVPANAQVIPQPEVPMQSLRTVVLASLLWASALIASSVFLKGLAIGDWVDSLLYLGAGVWISPYVLGRRSARCG